MTLAVFAHPFNGVKEAVVSFITESFYNVFENRVSRSFPAFDV